MNKQPRRANMNKVMSFNHEENNVQTPHFNQKQIDILKNSICKGASNEEFEMFLMACTKTQLDPFMRQIYAVKRKAKKPDGSWGDTMTIQTGIDGYRLIAERTGKYAPGPEPTYTYDKDGKLLSSTSYIKKMTRDGTWHTISASAYIDEYMQTFKDKQTNEERPTGMWATMPRTMLSKCAESQALRKAFPAEMSGVYTKEEMQQADVVVNKITLDQAAELELIIGDCDKNYRDWINNYLKVSLKIDNICDIPAELFEKIKGPALKRMEEYRSRQLTQKTEPLQQEIIVEEVK